VSGNRTVAVAESLTGGMLSSRLAQRKAASTWFAGGVVAYATRVKHELLAVRPGPVVSEAAAVDMAEGVRQLLGADVAVAVTGVGGPDPQDGIPPGTVWVAVAGPDRCLTRCFHFVGEPRRVCEETVVAALDLLDSLLSDLSATPNGIQT
jgi:nicotinamide-nucleotide amidase